MIQEIFDNISDEELLIAVLDIKNTYKKTGLTGKSVHEYVQKIRDLGYATKYDLETAKTKLLEQAAYRWAERQIAVLKIKHEDERPL